ncbi:MAG TPA: hypothetical protein VGB66_01975 [Longimicrobium sp.]|jgi:hypothetical protein
MRRAWGAAFALLALAGCIDFLPVSGPAGEDAYVYLVLESHNPGPGGASDTLVVNGFVAVGPRVPFTDETLRVGDRSVAPLRHAHGGWGYADTLRLAPGTLGQPVRVRLPTPASTPLPLQEFEFLSVARRGPEFLTVRRGTDIVLPIQPGAGPAAPVAESWTLSLLRGPVDAQIRTNAPLGEAVVIPAGLVPSDTSAVLDIHLRSSRGYRAEGPGVVNVAAEALLHWRVTLVP